MHPRLKRIVLSTSSTAVFAILLITVALSAVTYRSVTRGFEQTGVIAQCDTTARSMMKGLLEQETAVRGFTSTRKKLFLEPYDAADRQDGQYFAKIEQCVRETGVNFTGGATWRRINSRWDATARRLIANPDDSANLQLQYQAKGLMDAMRSYDRQADLLFIAARNASIASTKSDLLTAALASAGSVFVLGLLAVWLEINRRRQAALMHAALERHARELERSNASLRDFAYVASHDLQEPLRMVSSYTQLLERRYADRLDDDAKEFIAFAVDGAKRMEQLIKDTLAYSRVESDASNYQTVEIATVIDEARTRLGWAMEESQASIEVDEMPTVRGNRAQLATLMQNLIGNALKYRGEDAPHVRVGAQRVGSTWRLSVADNGIGIDPQYKERIFKMFQRLHTREKYSGTGIGLAIVKRIVEAHAGEVWVESKVGSGSTFYFTLPAEV